MSDVVVAWLLTYLFHSTVAFAIASIAARFVASHATRALLWKATVLAPVVTSLVIFAWGPAVSLVGRAPAAAVVAEPSSAGVLPTELGGDDEVVAAPARGMRAEWPQVVSATWAALAVLLLLRLAARAIAYRRYAGSDRADALVPLFDELARRAGIARAVTLLWSDRIRVPVAIGRSTIVVPRRAGDLPAAEQRVLLGHELAHLLRFDPQWLLLVAVAEAVLFFQPLNGVARRRVVEASELAADELAVALTRDGMSLAKCLVNVAAWSGDRFTGHVAAMASSQSQLGVRVEHLLSMRTSRRSRFAFAAVPLLVAATAALPAVRFTTALPARPAALSPTGIDLTADRGTPATAPAAGTPQPSSTAARRPEAPIAAAPAAADEDPRLQIFREVAARSQDRPDPVFNPAARSRWVLSVAGSGELVPVLIEKLRDADWIVREHATWALAVVPDRRAVDALVVALADEAWRVRGGAAGTLGTIGDTRAAPALVALLDDKHWQVRGAAAQSIGELSSNPAMIERLRPMLDDRHVVVRNNAEEAIAAIDARVRAK